MGRFSSATNADGAGVADGQRARSTMAHLVDVDRRRLASKMTMMSAEPARASPGKPAWSPNPVAGRAVAGGVAVRVIAAAAVCCAAAVAVREDKVGVVEVGTITVFVAVAMTTTSVEVAVGGRVGVAVRVGVADGAAVAG